MKKIILVYGLISGTIVGGMMLATMPLWQSGVVTFENGEYVGYTTMIIALSLIFFGIKSYRDKNGSITFLQGIKIGLLITLIASIMYSLTWEICLNTFDFTANFMTNYTEHYIAGLKANGATEAEIKEATESLTNVSELYKNPLIRFGMTLTEILPVGILITLISAALLRRKSFLPADNKWKNMFLLYGECVCVDSHSIKISYCPAWLQNTI